MFGANLARKRSRGLDTREKRFVKTGVFYLKACEGHTFGGWVCIQNSDFFHTHFIKMVESQRP